MSPTTSIVVVSFIDACLERLRGFRLEARSKLSLDPDSTTFIESELLFLVGGLSRPLRHRNIAEPQTTSRKKSPPTQIAATVT